MKVLIIGAAGRLGRRLTRALAPNHALVLGDIVPMDDPRFVRLDALDPEAAGAAALGCDAVVYLAIYDWAACDETEGLRHAAKALKVHVLGLHNALRAAWEAHARRFVYTSSVSAVDGIAPGEMIGSGHRHWSNGAYGMSKGLGEDVCRQFHAAHRLSVAVLRLGNIYAPEGNGAWMGNVFYPDLSKVCEASPSRVHVDDVTRAIELAMTSPGPAYGLAHVVGDNPGRRWDLEAARRLYGWAPRHSFDERGALRGSAARP